MVAERVFFTGSFSGTVDSQRGLDRKLSTYRLKRQSTVTRGQRALLLFLRLLPWATERAHLHRVTPQSSERGDPRSCSSELPC